MLEPTFLQGEQISKWCNGAAEDKVLIPNGYVGNPKGSQYIEINLKEADRRINMLLFMFVYIPDITPGMATAGCFSEHEFVDIIRLWR